MCQFCWFYIPLGIRVKTCIHATVIGACCDVEHVTFLSTDDVEVRSLSRKSEVILTSLGWYATGDSHSRSLSGSQVE